MKLFMSVTKSLTPEKHARTEHGQIGWCPVWNVGLKRYVMKEHIFFRPNGSAGIWLAVEEYRAEMAEFRRQKVELHLRRKSLGHLGWHGS